MRPNQTGAQELRHGDWISPLKGWSGCWRCPIKLALFGASKWRKSWWLWGKNFLWPPPNNHGSWEKGVRRAGLHDSMMAFALGSLQTKLKGNKLQNTHTHTLIWVVGVSMTRKTIVVCVCFPLPSYIAGLHQLRETPRLTQHMAINLASNLLANKKRSGGVSWRHACACRIRAPLNFHFF